MGSIEWRPRRSTPEQSGDGEALERVRAGERKLHYLEAQRAELGPLHSRRLRLEAEVAGAMAKVRKLRTEACLAVLATPSHPDWGRARAYVLTSGDRPDAEPPSIATPLVIAAEGRLAAVRDELAGVQALLAARSRELRTEFGLTELDR